MHKEKVARHMLKQLSGKHPTFNAVLHLEFCFTSTCMSFGCNGVTN